MGKNTEISPFYIRLEAACKKKGVTVATMASECGLSSSAAYKWKGETIPYGKTLQTIASYLGVTSEWLLNGDQRSMEQPVADMESVSAFATIDRIITLWEHDKVEAKGREDRLLTMLSELQGSEIRSVSNKIDKLSEMVGQLSPKTESHPKKLEKNNFLAMAGTRQLVVKN